MMRKSEIVFNSKISKRPSTSSYKRKLPIAFILVGLVTGAGLIMLSGCQSTHERMITVHQSKYHDVDQTCDALRKALEVQGYNCKAILNLNKSMAKHGVQLNRQVRVVQFGRAKYAHDMVMDNPEVSALMPCAFGVYEGNDRRVYISSMKRKLIGKMFGGTIERVMGGYVAQDQAKILNVCVENKRFDNQSATTGVLWPDE